MPTKYERVYGQIKTELADIKTDYNYNYDSTAFGHLVLKMLFDLADDEANEAITDGNDDNGIDAIYFEQKDSKTVIHFFQFKFPESEAKINAAVTQAEILKLFNGFEHFVGSTEKFSSLLWNQLLIDKREELLGLDETDINILHIVRFSTCEMHDNIVVLDSSIQSFKDNSGNDVSSDNLFAKEITKLYESARLNTWPDFNIKYKKDLSPFEDENAKVYSYYVTLYNLYESLKDLQNEAFEGNVRYFDNSSLVNSGIMDTLDSDDINKFHLLNNGITIVCSSCTTNMPTDSIVVKKGSIINGAQTVGCIIKAIEKCKKTENADLERFKNSYVFVRVIQIQEKQELVDELVYTLNTQNQMKSSYSLSNDPQIKSIQKAINTTTKYFFQVKNNEFNHLKTNQQNFNKRKRDMIDIETAIQAFVSYEDIHDLAYISKNSKASLFSDDNRTHIIEEITKEKILDSYESYSNIMQITTAYRAYRKDITKTTILTALNISADQIDDYKFINTGNYLILFTLGLYCRKKSISPNQEAIVDVIKILAPLFSGEQNVSNLTRSKETFDNARALVDAI